MPLSSVTKSIQEGMAGTLGFVATVVGLGAIFGQMLESSGGAESLAHYLIKKFGKYLGMNEKQTLQSWTIMESVIALCGLAFVMIASIFV